MFLFRSLYHQKRRALCVAGAGLAAAGTFEFVRVQTIFDYEFMGSADPYIAGALAYWLVRRLLGWMFDAATVSVLGWMRRTVFGGSRDRA